MESDELNYQYPADDLNYGISYEEESKEAPIEFDAFIESLKSETENFQALVISSGIALISAGKILVVFYSFFCTITGNSQYLTIIRFLYKVILETLKTY